MSREELLQVIGSPTHLPASFISLCYIEGICGSQNSIKSLHSLYMCSLEQKGTEQQDQHLPQMKLDVGDQGIPGLVLLVLSMCFYSKISNVVL